MTLPSFKILNKELQKKKLHPIYLFLGDEEGEKDKAIKKIASILFESDEERKNSTSIFYMENSEELLSAGEFALSQSMFEDKKLCIMKDVDFISKTKENKFILSDIFLNLPGITTLIVTSSNKKDKNKVPAILSSIVKKTDIKTYIFWNFFDNDITNYIRISLSNINLSIDNKNISFLLEKTGNDIKKIDEAIEILRYSSQTEEISKENIEKFIANRKDVSIFEFIDLLFKKDPKALKYLREIYEENTPPLQILFHIVRESEIIEKYYKYKESGLLTNDAISKAGVYYKKTENFLKYTNKIKKEQLPKLFFAIAKCDLKIKSSTIPKNFLQNPIFSLAEDIIFRINS